jgi:hypothetical protein
MTSLTRIDKPVVAAYASPMAVAVAPLPITPATQAKAMFSALMHEVVNGHRPQIVQRFGARDEMVLIKTGDLASWLDAFVFPTEVMVEDGEYVASLPQMGLAGAGSTFEAAIGELVEETRVYAADYFDRPAFYAATDRGGHAPYLLRFALTPPDRQAELLLEHGAADAV